MKKSMIKNIFRKPLLLWLAMGIFIPGMACAVPSLNTPEEWSSPGIDSWQQIGGATLQNPESGGNPGGYLQVTLPASGSPQNYQVFANSGNFAGDQDYTAGLNPPTRATFDFMYNSVAPVGLSLYFYSETSGREWTRFIDPLTFASPGDWKNYNISLAYDPSLWDYGGGLGDPDSFLADLMDVDRIGFWVAMGSNPSGRYVGFDNFNLPEAELRIPEPDTVLLLAAVLLTMGLFHRRGIVEWVTKMRSLRRSSQ